MKPKLGSNVVIHLVVIAVVALGLWIGRDWPYETGLFPRATGTTIIVIAIISLLLEVRKQMRQPEYAAGVAPALEQGVAKRAFVSFAWLAGFIATIWLFGYVIASLLYVFLYMKVKGKQAWLITILIVAGAYAFMWSVFGLLLGIKWFPGAVWDWFGL